VHEARADAVRTFHGGGDTYFIAVPKVGETAVERHHLLYQSRPWNLLVSAGVMLAVPRVCEQFNAPSRTTDELHDDFAGFDQHRW
jgi:hypothetical protein